MNLIKSSLWCFAKRRAVSGHEAHCTALCCAKCGQCACITELLADHSEAERLRDMGIHEGVMVTVLQDGDPLLVRIGECRIGLGRVAAEKILCELI
ncbi:MAG: FeoA family protein [Abditibacteriaceae bacterium]